MSLDESVGAFLVATYAAATQNSGAVSSYSGAYEKSTLVSP